MLKNVAARFKSSVFPFVKAIVCKNVKGNFFNFKEFSPPKILSLRVAQEKDGSNLTFCSTFIRVPLRVTEG